MSTIPATCRCWEGARRGRADGGLYDKADVDHLLAQRLTHGYGNSFRVGGVEAKLACSEAQP
jgi:hypothetical protein